MHACLAENRQMHTHTHIYTHTQEHANNMRTQKNRSGFPSLLLLLPLVDIINIVKSQVLQCLSFAFFLYEVK